ncbi:hypothetical protein [Lacrimispora sp.]|uniref:hypothetical protein n=1 Tax=Lacrimispora sp. TaxID=2719234 RepID=UPI002864D4AD|nr:hypothetical protein [Lacrimispora sp.]MDR7812054.1 hypothetical protein [Lacrimispora sp.]
MKYFWLITIATKSIADISAISDDLMGAIITAIVTGTISIVGFIATNISMNKNFKNELEKQRNSLALDKMTTIPYDVLVLMDDLMDTDKSKSKVNKSKNLEKFKYIMNTVYCYGSKNAIKIVSLMQKENYDVSDNLENINKHRVFATYVLLATQIKYDITGIRICTELWFQMRMRDYSRNKENFKKETNNLVDELGLCEEFKII